MSKPVLYTFHLSIWSAAADLARIELGLIDKVDAKGVNVLEGENLSPEFLKINPGATVPVLVSDGVLYDDTTATIDYMIAISAVKIARRTPLTAAVHDDSLDPNFMLRSARNEDDVARKAGGKGAIATRLARIKEYGALPSAVPFQEHFDRRDATFSTMLDVFNGTASESVKQAFFATSQANYDAAKTFVLDTLPAAIKEGPFVAGAGPGEDDLHVAAWLFRAARSAGAVKEREGIEAFERWFGTAVPEKIKVLWSAWVVRDSWKTVYPDGTLH
ncbi:hypothetical protein K488DRAFT_86169 [Vararia minispora EC-137]|uniref:Uncharacterized protein n=1 Tax=Vararia minispora EC-137 TaxID=1314806 RepID=A0ACB8QLC1_9AGAM|nr:hypothetical protein K488DRAFT_86169 [Vararia minispora EC-137]